MIVFDLKCSMGHSFEAWFRSSNDYEDQINHKEVECPICGNADIRKAVMAPNVGVKGNRKTANWPGSTPVPTADLSPREEKALAGPEDMMEQISVGMGSLPKELQKELEEVLCKVQKHVDENCEYVGDEFAEEARKIHYGESKKRGIYGETTEEEAAELLDEGVDILPVPLLRKPGPADA